MFLGFLIIIWSNAECRFVNHSVEHRKAPDVRICSPVCTNRPATKNRKMPHVRICKTVETNQPGTKNILPGQLPIVIYNIILRGPIQSLGFGGLMSRIFITLSQIEQAPIPTKATWQNLETLIQIPLAAKTTKLLPHVRICRTLAIKRSETE